MVRTQTEAKRFFVDRVVAQARAEGMTLSDAERETLSWSESDPDLVVDPDLPERLAAEMSDEDYEKKIAGLLARSFQAEVARGPEAEAEWKEAAGILNQGDHYISVMLDQAGRLAGAGTNGGCARFAGQSLPVIAGWLVAAMVAGEIFAAIDGSHDWVGYALMSWWVAMPAAAVHILLRTLRVVRPF